MRGAVSLSFFSLLFTATTTTLVAAGGGTVWATPHDSYSSSVGVLGCKVNTNRIAYWPSSVDCSNICVSLSYGGRTVNLLKVDQSGGAHDVSYDAWNYLYTGFPASEKPTAGGAVAMDYQDLDASACADLIFTDGQKLPLSAANSMNFLASCLEQKGSWVGSNYVLYNILDPICSWGVDEQCSLDWAAGANQPTCAHALGAPVVLAGDPVYNIRYPSGQKVLASNGVVVANATGSGSPNAAGLVASGKTGLALLAAGWISWGFVLFVN
ncbi:hypothetical protein QBC46DRAFT_388080 [Diplogelasinospora grovesii]|uniref:Cerato-platanin n=1 Tax=Diplogelasinospora grovesii TaxID=303347 RepID=A0AAN6N7X9_9PEZI|nr:hypothetical protein QBC46DRAFT_388080 [Diplogelasinospora grovesii]